MQWISSLAVILFVAGVQAAEPRADGLAELRWMVGEWRGVGQGDPGTSGSERHIDSYLDGKYIRSQGRSVYPKQEKNPKGEIHAQLDLWSYDKARGSVVLRQFDTLGFVGTYVLDKAASGPDRWVLVAESLENVPKGWKARYVFTRKSEDEYHEMLELDPDGKGFQPYVTSRFLKVPTTGNRVPAHAGRADALRVGSPSVTGLAAPAWQCQVDGFSASMALMICRTRSMDDARG